MSYCLLLVNESRSGQKDVYIYFEIAIICVHFVSYSLSQIINSI